ncbi:MAG: tetratricopeptide repeat protein [Cyclobacteriaceae bacterium]|nr:tetratricopeptide repeat protein [Cyclobacteriaceae bacterium]
MGLLSKLFGKKSITLEEADKINKDYIAKNPEPKNDESALVRQASSLCTSGEFSKSLDLYLQLAEDYPNSKGLYLSQVGVNYYFLNDFNAAIDYYLKALDEGADSSMMDDNIWEACEALFNNDNDMAPINRYLELFPDGSYKKKANKILSK